jgi:hypothetical protein
MARTHEAVGHPTKYRHMHEHNELIAENPSGMDTLPTPHNFSSNPGFMSTAGMLGASAPANGDGVIRGTSARGSVRPVSTGTPGSIGPPSAPARPSGPIGTFNGR